MPDKVVLPADAWSVLIETAAKEGVFLEGNLLKLIDPGEDSGHRAYLESATRADKERRGKRLEVTKQVQDQNKALLKAKDEIEQSQQELQEALKEARVAQTQAEEARQSAEGAWKEAKNDLDYMQQKTQFELMGNIVRVALWVIIGVGAITTTMYAAALFGPDTNDSDTTLLANTWSNMFGILLTNSFSIIGTIMGVKYATEGRNGGTDG